MGGKIIMTIVFPVIFSKTNDEKNTVLVEIPDLDGMTEGFGIPDAIKMARDYIGGFCYELDDKDIPTPTYIGDIDLSKSEFAKGNDSFVSLVDLDLDAYRRKMMNRAVRRNVSIPAWLDQAAEKEHINFSRVLQEALIQKLNIG
jgi:hypothetical protein